MLKVEWEPQGGKASGTQGGLWTQGPRLKEFAYLPSPYAPNSLRAQWIASLWVISLL